jgi:phosphatidylinositol glycan class P protein
MQKSAVTDPERAIYGFFLLILSITFLILFILLSYLPVNWLNQIGLTYLPEKYWYLAIPSYLVILPFLTLAIYTTLNMRMVNSLNSVNNLKDEKSIYKPNNEINKDSTSLPPVADIPLTKICEILYLDKKKLKE